MLQLLIFRNTHLLTSFPSPHKPFAAYKNNQTNLILHVMLLLWLASKIFNSRQQSENPSELLTLKQSKDVTGWVCLILLH